jgi:membrane-associated phospholipid phosphatase
MRTQWPRRVRYDGARWAVAAASAAATLAVLYGVFVAWGPGQRADHAVYLAVLGTGPVLGPVAGVVRPYGPQVLLVAAAVLTVLCLFRRRLRPVVAAVLIVLCSLMGTRALRDALPRPDTGLGTFAVNGYPSGHVAVALALAVACVLLWPSADRRLPAAVGGGVAGATAVASVVVHAHLPVDVLGAPFVVALVCCGVLWVVRPLEETVSC